MRDRLTTLGELAGIATTTAGMWMLSPAVALIVAGLGVFVVSFVAGGRK